MTALVRRDRLGCLGPWTQYPSPERAPILPRETEAGKGELGLWPSADVMRGRQTPRLPLSDPHLSRPTRPHQAQPGTPMAPPGPPLTGPTRHPHQAPPTPATGPADPPSSGQSAASLQNSAFILGHLWGQDLGMSTGHSGLRGTANVLTLGSLRTPGSV